MGKLPGWAKCFPHGIIEEMTEKYGVSSRVVYALIKVESGGDPFATRFEPRYKAFYKQREFAQENLITVKTEEVHQATSWGLMQVMGGTARRLGLQAPIPVLIDPANNIEFACKLLQELQERYPKNVWDWAAAYNRGSVKLEDGDYVNARYVRKFKGYYDQV